MEHMVVPGPEWDRTLCLAEYRCKYAISEMRTGLAEGAGLGYTYFDPSQ
jgi:hypothetical protein